MRGLNAAIGLAGENFKVKEERDMIMSKIFEAVKNDDEDIQELAMQALVEVGKIHYEFIEEYFKTIAQYTASAA